MHLTSQVSDRETVDAFDRDAKLKGGYVYTTNSKLSSELATRRWHEALLSLVDIRGSRVLDIGCGDGMTTVSLFDRGFPASIHAVDPAPAAIEVGRKRKVSRPITFSVADAYSLPFAADSFDFASLCGVLHHVERPLEVLREALRVAPRILVIEPNGWSPILKMLERFSRYHIEHGEKSYTSWRFKSWMKAAGGVITRSRWAGLVPVFCPDWLARTAKRIEPLVESIPLINSLSCAIYVFVAERLPRKENDGLAKC